MRVDMARQLKGKAASVAKTFSDKTRGGNHAGETFNVERIDILSETTAVVTFNKEPTKKKAAAFFYFIASHKQPRWEYFFVTYNHLAGLERIKDVLYEIEQHNFKVATNE
jgi:hypothetical protein